MVDQPAIYEVARRSGVPAATVTRVMADGKRFSAATRERVRATAAGPGAGLAGPQPGLAAHPDRRPALPRPGQSGDVEEEPPLNADQVIRRRA